jgi:hypothetical protein
MNALFSDKKSPFESPFTSTGKGLPSLEELSEAYKQLELLKNNSGGTPRNVFTDISNEWKDTSDDEKVFIENSKEYLEANTAYQAAFSAFLVEYLGNDFLKTQHGIAAEKVLSVIKEKKESYKNKFVNDIDKIKTQNDKLEESNQELIKKNLDLQNQLKMIQEKLGGF